MIENELYIGYKNFDLEHAKIKHPATIYYYNTLNIRKYRDKPIKLIGMDFETNHKTSEIKLMGFYDGEGYDYYTSNFLGSLFNKVRYASKNNHSLCHWNKLDIFVIYKLFLLKLNDKQKQKESLERFGKVGGKYDNKETEWKIPPVVSIRFLGFEFGILNIIRSSIQFYFISDYTGYINKVWSYDIANLYNGGLAIEGKRFEYYSKIDKSAHLVDWGKFQKDEYYRNEIVLKSNYLDAKVCRDLGILVQENFKRVFGKYANTLISAGSLTRSAIILSIYNQYKDKIKNKKKLKEKINDIAGKIPIINYQNKWVRDYGEDFTKDLICLFNETYSGGYIETIRYGYSKNAWLSDIASAYPSIEIKLYDLTDSKITKGNGTPPEISHSYCFIRGEIETPLDLNFNPITIKHPFDNMINIRGSGNYIASYTLESRKLLIKYGCRFKNETWYNIETTGKLSPFADAIKTFWQLRLKLIAEGDSAEILAKTCMNSGYGITYECTPVHQIIDGDIQKVGYRAGEFYNPLYASIITSRIRNMLFESAMEIEKNGGKVLTIMTDCVYWQGEKNHMPDYLWKKEKTLGFFEEPEKVKNFVCLGSGRYEYYKQNNKYKGKTRGISISDMLNENGINVSDFNWRSLIYKSVAQNTNLIKVKTRILVSPAMVLHYKDYDIKDLGLVKTDDRDLDILAGKSKRLLDLKSDWLKRISNSLIETKPLYIIKGLDGRNKLMDYTLRGFRDVVMGKKLHTKEERQSISRKRQNKRYRKRHKKDINKKYREKYQLLRGYNVSVADAKIYANRTYKQIYEYLGKEHFNNENNEQ